MSESAKSFFESLRHDFPDSVLPDGVKLPVDIGRSLLTEEEMEAECLDWCVQFLNSRYAGKDYTKIRIYTVY